MYAFNYPILKSDATGINSLDFAELIPGQDVRLIINLCTANSAANFQKWSIHAIASAVVNIEVLMSNFFDFPYRNDNGQYQVPASSDGFGRLFVPCTSIQSFNVNPGENCFKQGDFNDACKFLALIFTAQYPAGSNRLTDTAGVPVDRVRFALSLAFK